MIDREQLQREGYTVLRDAIPHDWLDGLRAAFDACEPPSDAWPVPRGRCPIRRGTMKARF